MTKQSHTERMVRIAITSSIPSVVRGLSADPGKVLAEAGVSPDVFEDPDNLISFRQRAHLLKACTDHTGCNHFGLLVGQNIGLSSFGLLGYLVMHSPDVEAAIHSLVRYFHLHAQGSLALLEINEGLAFLGYSIYEERVEAAEQLVDAAVAAVFNLLQQLCGSHWEPMQICLARRRPDNLQPYKQYFKAPLRFDAEHSGIFFPEQWLQQPVQDADPELYRLLKKQIERMEHAYSEDFPEQVRRILNICLLTRQFGIDHVAEVLGIHSRTLHRRLRTCNTSFHELVDECRFGVACQMLESSAMHNAQIADLLGYSDARAFGRAFKRWSGTTPSSWRAHYAHVDHHKKS